MSDDNTLKSKRERQYSNLTGFEIDEKCNLWLYNEEGQLHSYNDHPAFFSLRKGIKKWYQKDVLTRANGPAIDYGNGIVYFYLNGLRHNLYGPAVFKPAEQTQKKKADHIYYAIDGVCLKKAEWEIERLKHL